MENACVLRTGLQGIPAAGVLTSSLSAAIAIRYQVECGSHCSIQRQLSQLFKPRADAASQAMPEPSVFRPVIPFAMPPVSVVALLDEPEYLLGFLTPFPYIKQ